MPESQEPSKLLQQALSGDRQAVQQLLLAYHEQLMMAIASKLPADLRGQIAAEDICQEVYIAAIRNLRSFEPESDRSFLAWLRTIAERKLTDAVRARRAVKRGRRQVDAQTPVDGASVVALLDLVAVHQRTPSMSVMRRDAAAAVRSLLGELQADYRLVLQYRYFEGLSVADTADRMGRSEGAVKMLCNRAIQQLADRIGDISRFLSRG